jgi:hypothetical protein
MKFLDSLRFRIATLFRRSQMSSEMEDELRSHIQHRADDLERSGLFRAEAERVERSSARISRMFASAFACCANLPASQLSPF